MNDPFRMYLFISCIIAFLIWVFGFWCGKKASEHVFHKFRDEMHKQYLYILEKYGIKRKSK